MMRLSIVLLAATLFSALYLVRVQYESRRVFTQLDRAVAEAQRLEYEHDRLAVERRAQSKALRVEKLARDELHMRRITPAVTEYVHLEGDGPAAGGAR